MTPEELKDPLQLITEKILYLMTDFKKKTFSLPLLLDQSHHNLQSFQYLCHALSNNLQKVAATQLAYREETSMLGLSLANSCQEDLALPIDLKHPLFQALNQFYLLTTKHWTLLLDTMEYSDPQVRKRVQFFGKQLIQALSPANFLTTNPEVLLETLNSRGNNILMGLHHCLLDLEKGEIPGMGNHCLEPKFRLGQELATTAGKVIFRNAMMELIQYAPQTSKVQALPLLIIPPWINKYYILDLSPKNSLIAWLVAQGMTVFVISWVNPDAGFAQKDLWDYLQEGPLTAITLIQKQLSVQKVNTLGFCIGGTLLALLLAYQKAQQEDSICSATFLATLMDFSEPGDLAVFVDEEQITQLEKEMQAKGYLSGKFMASSFLSLRANDFIWQPFIKNYLHGKKSSLLDVLFWNADTTNMPAAMQSQYLRWMYLHNDLVKPGKIRLNERPIDIRNLTVPTFFLSTEKDHIAPWKSTYKGFQLMQGPKRFVLGGSGHIMGIIHAPPGEKYGYKTNDSNTSNPEEWLSQAKYNPGSWWPEWLLWLQIYSGSLVPAPLEEELPFPPLMEAPGSYVLR